MSLALPVGYQVRDHPLRALRKTTGGAGIEVPAFFDGEPDFVDSVLEPLVQLADLIGWIAGRALQYPDDRSARAAYAQLRLRQYYPTRYRARFRFLSRRDVDLRNLHRYRHLLA